MLTIMKECGIINAGNKERTKSLKRTEMNTTEFFGTEKISKILLKLAPPVMLAQLIQALYNIVDSLFMGRYSESGLTALSIIYPIQLLMISLRLYSLPHITMRQTFFIVQFYLGCPPARAKIRYLNTAHNGSRDNRLTSEPTNQSSMCFPLAFQRVSPYPCG